ncbi:FUSC family protein, partial [Streptomyces seoulensis]
RPALLSHGRALTDLRATADAARGEWWQRPFPADRLALAEQAGHRTLAAAVRYREAAPSKQDRHGTTEDTRP